MVPTARFTLPSVFYHNLWCLLLGLTTLHNKQRHAAYRTCAYFLFCLFLVEHTRHLRGIPSPNQCRTCLASSQLVSVSPLNVCRLGFSPLLLTLSLSRDLSSSSVTVLKLFLSDVLVLHCHPPPPVLQTFLNISWT